MSGRVVRRPVDVHYDPATGAPISVHLSDVQGNEPVLRVIEHIVEPMGTFDMEHQRDIWRVELPTGRVELHCLRFTVNDADAGDGDGMTDGQWLLWKWED